MAVRAPSLKLRTDALIAGACSQDPADVARN